jgi:Na+-driven multidrug efflux pump
MHVVYRFILDSLFYGGYSFSWNMGVLGVAWSDMLASLALLITAIILIRHVLFDKLKNWRSFFTFKDWRAYLKVGAWSGTSPISL